MPGNGDRPQSLAERVRCYFEARDHIRRGICLLNAGAYDRAAESFTAAMRLNPESESLGAFLARCHVGRRDYGAAAEEMARLVERDPEDITSRIRHAMLLWKRGDMRAAIASLRDGVAYAPDCAELHFQLGTLLAAFGGGEEAEMRFTQALSLDGRHCEAMVSLAMCHAAGGDAGRALGLLKRAQSLQPHNARIGHLLSLAFKVAPAETLPAGMAAGMPCDDTAGEDATVDELANMIESDVELVGAFIDLPARQGDGALYDLLRLALERSLSRHGDRADLHDQYGRLLDRLGDTDQAVAAVERALRLDPGYVPALIHSAKLHRKIGRRGEAVDRLERALALGARYADVYVMLGELYRESGQTPRARDAFREAIRINEHYTKARESLEALSA